MPKSVREEAMERAAGASYALRRRLEMPAAGDQLDALWKGLEALAKGQPLPAETTAMMTNIAAVKAKHKKPGL